MFADGTYLIDAGWLFFSLWSLAVLTFFLIEFAGDLLAPNQNIESSAQKKG